MSGQNTKRKNFVGGLEGCAIPLAQVEGEANSKRENFTINEYESHWFQKKAEKTFVADIAPNVPPMFAPMQNAISTLQNYKFMPPPRSINKRVIFGRHKNTQHNLSSGEVDNTQPLPPPSNNTEMSILVTNDRNPQKNSVSQQQKHLESLHRAQMLLNLGEKGVQATLKQQKVASEDGGASMPFYRNIVSGSVIAKYSLQNTALNGQTNDVAQLLLQSGTGSDERSAADQLFRALLQRNDVSQQNDEETYDLEDLQKDSSPMRVLNATDHIALLNHDHYLRLTYEQEQAQGGHKQRNQANFSEPNSCLPNRALVARAESDVIMTASPMRGGAHRELRSNTSQNQARHVYNKSSFITGQKQYLSREAREKIENIAKRCTNKLYFDPLEALKQKHQQQKQKKRHLSSIPSTQVNSKGLQDSQQSQNQGPSPTDLAASNLRFSASHQSNCQKTLGAQAGQKRELSAGQKNTDVSTKKIFKDKELFGELAHDDHHLDIDSDLSLDQDEEGENSFDESTSPSLTADDKRLNERLLLLKSVYEGRPSTVFFPYPSCCGVTRDKSRCVAITEYEVRKFDMKYKATSTRGTPYQCITRALECAGFQDTDEADWNVYWGVQRKNIKNLKRFQRVNHFPGCWNLGRKDFLWRNLVRSKRSFPRDFDFIPNTYLLASPSDWERFTAKRDQAGKDQIWIMKPVSSACGRGIKVICKKTKVAKRRDYLVCEYVTNPHLINGLKYDLRIYVLVSSYDPLRIYIFNDGLARFATEKYTTSIKELSKRYVHLTNWSVNKNSKNFVKNRDSSKDDFGSKWSLSALIKKYGELGINAKLILDRIKDIIIKTCISAEPHMLDMHAKSQEHRSNCFELYGFDVLIDQNLKPWILEVNVCPSLNSSSPLDRKIKHTLVSDILNLIGILPYDKKKFSDDLKTKAPGNSLPANREERVLFSKNMNTLHNLDHNNCLQKLNPEDWTVLFETDEEHYRRGHFERIFPTREKGDYYLQFFEYQRYNNLLVHKWLSSPVNFLEKILKKQKEAVSV